MKRKLFVYTLLSLLIIFVMSACRPGPQAVDRNKKTIVVTYSVLGSIVKELAGNPANVVVLMPNGADPHEWEPSARDIEALNRADLIVQNGLDLENGLLKTLKEASLKGVKTFTACDHITIRKVGEGEGISNSDPDQVAGADDPHFWTDPIAMKSVVAALADQIKSDLAIDVDTRSQDLQTRLDSLNKEISDIVATLSPADRKLVTGHESMGYFAQRYGFKLIGAVIPSITSQAEVSASGLAALKKLIEDNKVKAIFTELGTSSAVVNALGKETGVKVIQLSVHSLPEDGSYFTFERNLARIIVDGLR